MTEDELLRVIRVGIDRVAALAPEEREPALDDLRASAERIGLSLGFTRWDAKLFAGELVAVLRSSASTSTPPVQRVLH